jgi:hypothetical protein
VRNESGWGFPTQFFRGSETRVGLHLKCPLFLSGFNENVMCQQILLTLPNIKFHENPFSGSEVVNVDRRTFRLTDTAGPVCAILSTLSGDQS